MPKYVKSNTKRTKGARGAKGAVPIVSKVRRTSTSAYGSRKEWAVIAEEIKRADGYKCRKCGSTTNLQVDHIIPIAQGGQTVKSNLWTLCLDCHIKRPRHYKYANLMRAGANHRNKK